MKEEKTKGKKKNLYYLLLAACVLLLAAATVLTVYFVTGGGGETLETPPLQEPEDPDGQDGDGDEDEPDEPTGAEGTFASPIAVEELSREYDVVFVNETTDFIYRHKAVDFAAEEGTDVFSMADGVIEAISLSEQLGNMVTVDHGDGLKTIYCFVEPAEGLQEGDSVTKGQKIAEVAAAYGTEASDGTHLHLEITLNGECVDPAGYLEPVADEK